MSFTVQDYIDQVRSHHPAFSRYMVPDKALADFATREQRRLLTLALQRDRSFLAQSCTIFFDLANADADAPGTAGVGTTGGVPAVSSNGSYAAVQATTGSAVAVGSGSVLVSDTPVSAATATTLSATGVAWTTNIYATAVAFIVAGTGANTPPRAIVSNTASQLTVSAPWEVTPDATSEFRIVTPTTTVDGTLGAVTDLPATTTVRGYLVKLNAQGAPYLDYAAPLVAHISRGVPLPSVQAVLGGRVRYRSSATGATAQSDYAGRPLQLVHPAMRDRVAFPSAYLQSGTLCLCGSRLDWQDVESIELTYAPIPPALTARTDYFLLPDTALPVLAAKGALFAASRITGLPDVPQPPADLLLAQANDAEAAFVATISLSTRARLSRVRPGWS